MSAKKLFLTGALAFFVSSFLFHAEAAGQFSFWCAFTYDTTSLGKCHYLRPSIDTTRTFAIYCCDSSVTISPLLDIAFIDQLPGFLRG